MKTKEEYLLALDRIDNAYNNFDRSISAVGRFIQDFNLLLGLVNEHFEEQQETNFEHYKDEILENCMWNLALVDGKPKRCNQTKCSDCEFNNEIPRNCHKRTIEWLNQTYTKPKYKLTQFEYDLLNAYKNSGMRQCISNYGTLLELYKKGYFKDIGTSIPIHEVLDNYEVIE